MKMLDGMVHTIPMQLFKTDERQKVQAIALPERLRSSHDKAELLDRAQLPESSIDWVDRERHSLMTQKQPKEPEGGGHMPMREIKE